MGSASAPRPDTQDAIDFADEVLVDLRRSWTAIRSGAYEDLPHIGQAGEAHRLAAILSFALMRAEEEVRAPKTVDRGRLASATRQLIRDLIDKRGNPLIDFCSGLSSSMGGRSRLSEKTYVECALTACAKAIEFLETPKKLPRGDIIKRMRKHQKLRRRLSSYSTDPAVRQMMHRCENNESAQVDRYLHIISEFLVDRTPSGVMDYTDGLIGLHRDPFSPQDAATPIEAGSLNWVRNEGGRITGFQVMFPPDCLVPSPERLSVLRQDQGFSAEPTVLLPAPKDPAL